MLFGQGGLRMVNESQCWFCSGNVGCRMLIFEKILREKYLILIPTHPHTPLLPYLYPNPPISSLILLHSYLLYYYSYTLLHSRIHYHLTKKILLGCYGIGIGLRIEGWLLFEFKVKYLSLELNVWVWTERVGSIFEKILRENTGPVIPPSYIISLALALARTRTRTRTRVLYTIKSYVLYLMS